MSDSENDDGGGYADYKLEVTLTAVIDESVGYFFDVGSVTFDMARYGYIQKHGKIYFMAKQIREALVAKVAWLQGAPYRLKKSDTGDEINNTVQVPRGTQIEVYFNAVSDHANALGFLTEFRHERMLEAVDKTLRANPTFMTEAIALVCDPDDPADLITALSNSDPVLWQDNDFMTGFINKYILRLEEILSANRTCLETFINTKIISVVDALIAIIVKPVRKPEGFEYASNDPEDMLKALTNTTTSCEEIRLLAFADPVLLTSRDFMFDFMQSFSIRSIEILTKTRRKLKEQYGRFPVTFKNVAEICSLLQMYLEEPKRKPVDFQKLLAQFPLIKTTQDTRSNGGGAYGGGYSTLLSSAPGSSDRRDTSPMIYVNVYPVSGFRGKCVKVSMAWESITFKVLKARLRTQIPWLKHTNILFYGRMYPHADLEHVRQNTKLVASFAGSIDNEGASLDGNNEPYALAMLGDCKDPAAMESIGATLRDDYDFMVEALSKFNKVEDRIVALGFSSRQALTSDRILQKFVFGEKKTPATLIAICDAAETDDQRSLKEVESICKTKAALKCYERRVATLCDGQCSPHYAPGSPDYPPPGAGAGPGTTDAAIGKLGYDLARLCTNTGVRL